MKTEFIPYDYEAFDWQGKNYVKLIGRTPAGKRICVIDNYDANFWAVLQDNLTQTKINKLIEKIKDALSSSPHLSEDEKSNAMRKIEEWIVEDKAENLLYEELVKIAQKFEDILEEIGLV